MLRPMMVALYLLIILTALGSGALIFLLKTDDQKVVKLLLAFSGAFLIGISFLMLIPEVFSTPARHVGVFVLLGFLIQLILELITEGAEHGHRHEHSEGERASPFLLLIGLSIHAFLEGMPLGGSYGAAIRHSLITGIIVHNIPISLTLMSLFLHYGCSRWKAFFFLFVFAIMTPLGSLVSSVFHFASPEQTEQAFTYIMAVVIGIFLHVSTSILFEAEEHHRYNLQKFMTVCLGLMVAFGLSLI